MWFTTEITCSIASRRKIGKTGILRDGFCKNRRVRSTCFFFWIVQSGGWEAEMFERRNAGHSKRKARLHSRVNHLEDSGLPGFEGCRIRTVIFWCIMLLELETGAEIANETTITDSRWNRPGWLNFISKIYALRGMVVADKLEDAIAFIRYAKEGWKHLNRRK